MKELRDVYTWILSNWLYYIDLIVVSLFNTSVYLTKNCFPVSSQVLFILETASVSRKLMSVVSDTPLLLGSPHGVEIDGVVVSLVGGRSVSVSLFLLFLSGGDGTFAGIGVVVPGSLSGTEGSGVSPDVVLGFSEISSGEELLLHVPEIEAVSPDGLHDKGEEAEDEHGDHDGHGVVLCRVSLVDILIADGDVHDVENPDEPVDGCNVPGVDVSVHVESVQDREVLGVGGQPDEHHGE